MSSLVKKDNLREYYKISAGIYYSPTPPQLLRQRTFQSKGTTKIYCVKNINEARRNGLIDFVNTTINDGPDNCLDIRAIHRYTDSNSQNLWTHDNKSFSVIYSIEDSVDGGRWRGYYIILDIERLELGEAL